MFNRVDPVEFGPMDSGYPQNPKPPPVGFELQVMEEGQLQAERQPPPGQPPPGQPPGPLGFEALEHPPDYQLYPTLDPQNGPTEGDPATGPPDPSSSGLAPAAEGDEEAANGKKKISHQDADGQSQIEANSYTPEAKELVAKRETLFFRDGKKRIDFVLAYKDSEDGHKKQRREVFEKNLQQEGMEIEYEDKLDSQDAKTNFVKIHAPWDVLTRMAELMSFKMPIKEYDIDDDIDGCFGKMPNPLELSEDLIKEEPDFFTADFCRDREKMFIIEDKDTFFTNAQRSLIVYELLLRTRYDEDFADKFGIDRLLKHGAYTSAFPLHEGPYKSEHSILTVGANNDRHLLFETWARPGRWYYYQPLDLIRKYFGEKVGVYFAWLGFYTAMLIPAALVGLIVFIYGCATLFSNPPSEEICNMEGAGNFTMCPLCDKRCTYWKLGSSCTYSRLTYLFDNYATVFFAGFMAVWATMFLEFWKRQQAEMRYDWDIADYELEEHMRPDFEAKCKHHRKNPVTQLMEPFMPLWSKAPRRLTSVVVIIFMICCVLGAVFGVIMYRIIVVALLYSAPSPYVREYAKIATTCTAALINLVLIMILNRVYAKIALVLTEMERPRTDSEYENSFTFKMFLFQFINYYASIFYIAFFKGRVGGRPGFFNYRFGVRQDECDPAGCLIELCIQLGIVMVGKQAFNNAKEVIIPKILNWCRSRKAIKNESEENLYTRWEQDNDLGTQPFLGLFEEYLEMVIQYGFITIFVAAFPLAPLFALINNVMEIRLDAYKFVTQWQRPVAFKTQDIGIWYGILQGITYIAVLTNAFIIGWTSDFVPKMVYKFTISPDQSLKGYINDSLSFFDVNDFQNRSIPEDADGDGIGMVKICRYVDYRLPPWNPDKYDYTAQYWHVFCARLAFVICFEHCVFFLTWLVAYLIPDVPARVKMLMLREKHLAKEARYDAAFSTLHDDRREIIDSLNKLA